MNGHEWTKAVSEIIFLVFLLALQFRSTYVNRQCHMWLLEHLNVQAEKQIFKKAIEFTSNHNSSI